MVPNLITSQILLRNLTNMTLEKIDFVEADERLNERVIDHNGGDKKSHLYKHLQEINYVFLSCID